MLTFHPGYWSSGTIETPAGKISFAIAGDKDSPNPQALEAALELLKNPKPAVEAATRYLEADNNFRDFSAGSGDLVLDGFQLNPESGSFSVLFGLGEWADAMVTVKFERGIPKEVWLDD